MRFDHIQMLFIQPLQIFTDIDDNASYFINLLFIWKRVARIL